MYKSLCYISLFFSLFVCSISSYAHLQNTQSIQIVSQYPSKLKFTITRYPEVLLDIPSTGFELNKNQQISSRIAQGSAYIRVEGRDEEGREISAFWSVDSATGIHGYLDGGLAYSWNHNDNAKIVFCHPREYPCSLKS